MTTRPLPRDERGRVRWKDPSVKQRVRARLAKGESLRKIAAAFGVKVCALEQACEDYHFNEVPAGWVLTSEVAVDAGASRCSVLTYARRDEADRPWGSVVVVPKQWAANFVSQWRERNPEVLDEPPEGYVSRPQIAQMWGQSEATVLHTLKRLKVPYVRVRNGGVVQFYYLLDDARRYAPVRYRSRPKGLLTKEQLADAIGIKPVTIECWRHRWNVPAVPWRGSNNRTLFYDPQQVLGWLAERPRLRRYIPALQAHLDQQEQEAT